MGFFRFLGGAVAGVALAPFTGGASLVATGLATGLITEVIGDDDDKTKISNAMREGYSQGFDSGYDKGAIDTAKKFAAELERNDNFRISAFALGNHISQMAGNPYEKVEVIVLMLGSPSAKILSSYIRSENKKIIDTKPTFYQIQQNYLKNLSGEDLKLLDEFLDDVVNEGDYNSACSNFYNNDWKNYLRNNSLSSQNESAQYLYQRANNYFYGWNGYEKNQKEAKKLYIQAANLGHEVAKIQLREYFMY